MKNINKTSTFVVINSLTFISGAILIQARSQSKLAAGSASCSYLDPMAVDVFAFALALFLVIEGVYRIKQNKNDVWQKQITRSMRIAFGCSILTLHIIQISFKF